MVLSPTSQYEESCILLPIPLAKLITLLSSSNGFWIAMRLSQIPLASFIYRSMDFDPNIFFGLKLFQLKFLIFACLKVGILKTCSHLFYCRTSYDEEHWLFYHCSEKPVLLTRTLCSSYSVNFGFGLLSPFSSTVVLAGVHLWWLFWRRRRDHQVVWFLIEPII